MPDAMESFRQHVQHEAPDELSRRQGHRCVSTGALAPVIFDVERHASLVGGNQPAIGYGNAVGVTGEVGQYLLGSCEWPLGIDVPLGVVERLEE